MAAAEGRRRQSPLTQNGNSRYPSVVQLASSAKTVLALDLMSLRLSDFWKMQHYMPAIQQVFELNRRETMLEEN